MGTNDKMGVLTLMSHLIVTLSILVVYLVSMLTGHSDQAITNLLFIAGGYWFGAVGSESIKKAVKKNSSEGDKTNE
jgi:hypothetical protein